MLWTCTSSLIDIALQTSTNSLSDSMVQLCLNTVRRVDCHLSQESSPTSPPWLATSMQIEPDEHADLDSFEGVLPSREKWEFRAQIDARTNAQLAQEQTLQARAQNKTSAQMASEIAPVHKLTTLLAEQVDFLADLACSRHGYIDQVKTRTTAKAQKRT